MVEEINGDGSSMVDSKKRKHNSLAEKPRKKKKQIESEIEPVDQAQTSTAPLRKNKKEKKEKEEEGQMSGAEGVLRTTDGHTANESIDSSQRKKKKKKAKTDEDVTVQPIKGVESTTLEHNKDQDMKDAPTADDAVDNDLPRPEVTNDEDVRGLLPDVQQAPVLDLLDSDEVTSFVSVRTSLYIFLPPIGMVNPLSSALALHLAPLLLTYFQPLEGVLIAYQDASLSSRPEAVVTEIPLDTTGTSVVGTGRIGDEWAASWQYLNVTMLVFRPDRESMLKGYSNVMAEDFIGLVCYNYFQASIPKSRIPSSWSWNGPSRESVWQRKQKRKGKLNDSSQEESTQDSMPDTQETAVEGNMDGAGDEDIIGRFVDNQGKSVDELMNLRVVDIEIHGGRRGDGISMQIDGSLLDREEEARVTEEERSRWKMRHDIHKQRGRAPDAAMMSGGLNVHSRAVSIASSR